MCVSSKVPARHWQAAGVVLAAIDTVFGGHAKHTAKVLAAFSVLNWFAGHSYASHAELPSKAWKVPAGHTVHAAGPVVFLNVPAAHSVHTAPFAPVYPVLHSHAPAEPLAAGESELRGHS